MARTKIYHKILANIGNVRTVFYKDRHGGINAVYGRLVRLALGSEDHLYLWVDSKFSTQIDFEDITAVE